MEGATLPSQTPFITYPIFRSSPLTVIPWQKLDRQLTNIIFSSQEIRTCETERKNDILSLDLFTGSDVQSSRLVSEPYIVDA